MTSLERLYALAKNAGAHAAERRYGFKYASFVPGLTTPDEDAAARRAELIVPPPMTGPLAHRGYAELNDSPGRVPDLPEPADGSSYSPEERAFIMRTVLARMGSVARDRVERDNLAAGGHIRIASAPWTSGRFGVNGKADAGQDARREGPTDYVPSYTTGERGQIDPFFQADMGSGMAKSKGRPTPPAGKTPQYELDADTFRKLTSEDAAKREEVKSHGNDPLAEQREQQRMWGHSVTSDAQWGPAVTTGAGNPSASPVGPIGRKL